jgi:beta-N-acetylhexosaminidase
LRLLALLQAVLATLGAGLEDEVASLTPHEKAALVVVAGLPAPAGVGGVIVRDYTRDELWPPGAIVFADQEGGEIRAFPRLPPKPDAARIATEAKAFALGEATGRALRRAGVDVDLAPVLDAYDGPLGPRHFRSAAIAVAFARGLAAGGAGACAKHFPGLGSTPKSTDEARVRGVLRGWELAGFRDAVEAGVPCVMVGHAVYPRLGRLPASLEPATYALLRSMGFEGVVITDSLDVIGRADVPRWVRLAVRAGADLVLVPEAGDAERAIAALLPLARAGELDEHVERVLRFRRELGVASR